MPSKPGWAKSSNRPPSTSIKSLVLQYLCAIQSSYQNDPVRSAIELVLLLFFVRYLLSPSYSTRKQNYIKLREEVRTQPDP